MSSGCQHMMLWWHYDLVRWECLHMHLVTWAEVVTLSGDGEVDTLVPPFREGEMVAPSPYHDTLLQYLNMPHIKSAKVHFIKNVEKYNLQLECIMYLKTWVCTKSTKQSTFGFYLQRLIWDSEWTSHTSHSWESNTSCNEEWISNFLQWYKSVYFYNDTNQ